MSNIWTYPLRNHQELSTILETIFLYRFNNGNGKIYRKLMFSENKAKLSFNTFHFHDQNS